MGRGQWGWSRVLEDKVGTAKESRRTESSRPLWRCYLYLCYEIRRTLSWAETWSELCFHRTILASNGEVTLGRQGEDRNHLEAHCNNVDQRTSDHGGAKGAGFRFWIFFEGRDGKACWQMRRVWERSQKRLSAISNTTWGKPTRLEKDIKPDAFVSQGCLNEVLETGSFHRNLSSPSSGG